MAALSAAKAVGLIAIVLMGAFLTLLVAAQAYESWWPPQTCRDVMVQPRAAACTAPVLPLWAAIVSALLGGVAAGAGALKVVR
jgi:hypothetical protein